MSDPDLLTKAGPEPWALAGHQLSSRLILGTGGVPSLEVLRRILAASGTALSTVALRRVSPAGDGEGSLLAVLREAGVAILPNTAGCHTASEAMMVARLGREALGTDWVKLEVVADDQTLLPDPVELIDAARALVRDGFVVLPYTNDDPIVARHLERAGCAAIMPLGAPIGSNRGLESRAFLEIIIAQARVPVVVDAGLGAPSHAAAALEMGADAVLVNTAIAVAADPVAMADAFRRGVEAGRIAFEAGLSRGIAVEARATSPLTAFLAESTA